MANTAFLNYFDELISTLDIPFLHNITRQEHLEVSWYSLKQYIGCIIRQAFNYYCSLLQV